jgi:hypothetical protein
MLHQGAGYRLGAEQEAEELTKQGVDFLNSYIQSSFSAPTEIAGGIPVGQDPIFPMAQDEFRDLVLQRIDRREGNAQKAADRFGGSLINAIRSGQLKGV